MRRSRPLRPRKQGKSVEETTTERPNLAIQIDKRSTLEDLLGFVEILTVDLPSGWDLLAIVRAVQSYLETFLKKNPRGFPSSMAWNVKKLCLTVFEILLQFELIRDPALWDELLGDRPDFFKDNKPDPREPPDVTVEMEAIALRNHS
jgi:hypothetical protein